MEKNSLIYVAGHRGLVGSAICRSLRRQGFERLLLRTHAELDLTDSAAVHRFFELERPQHVFLAAAKVGGILANDMYPAEFIRENLVIETNVIDASYRAGVDRLMFLGSSCIYPKLCPQPIKEEYLLTGPLEPTNRPYALAKIAGIELCWSYNRQYQTRYLCAMPSNLYGPGDNFDPQKSHVLPALIRKVAEAKALGQKEIVVWGTGAPRRELMFSEDLAEACVFLMSLEEEAYGALLKDVPLINIGTGQDVTIRELAEQVCDVLGFTGELVFDTTRPDGTPQKLLDVSRMFSLGWKPKTSLAQGIALTYEAARPQLQSVATR
ncbi:MAG TPA: GDP-L-fucose synthase [Acidobacteriaceae bacterium]|nr:GDP-L-fucose synthase [Acidobacteriaceae bacterium]